MLSQTQIDILLADLEHTTAHLKWLSEQLYENRIMLDFYSQKNIMLEGYITVVNYDIVFSDGAD
jgi:hypothetical protein